MPDPIDNTEIAAIYDVFADLQSFFQNNHSFIFYSGKDKKILLMRLFLGIMRDADFNWYSSRHFIAKKEIIKFVYFCSIYM